MIMEITLYLVGVDEDDAMETFPFDSQESAEDYSKDNPGTTVFSVTARIDFSTIEEIVRFPIADPNYFKEKINE